MRRKKKDIARQMTRLEYLRRTSGLSQSALAGRLLYSKMAICRLEREHVGQPEQVSPRLADALERYWGESIQKLMSPVEVGESAREPEPAATSEEP